MGLSAWNLMILWAKCNKLLCRQYWINSCQGAISLEVATRSLNFRQINPKFRLLGGSIRNDEIAVDVLVTDGFTGNVLLKTSEGVSSFILQQIHQALLEVLPEQRQAILRDLHNQFDYEEYNGAIICGVDCRKHWKRHLFPRL